MANMFNEDGTYNKTEWKTGDKITAGKLNKIEDALEAINNNDISRHVEADTRLDALEEQAAGRNEVTNERIEELNDLVLDNKDELDLAIYDINSRMTFLEEELNEGIEEVNNVASTVDGKIAEVDSKGYATEEYVNEAISNIEVDGIDLSEVENARTTAAGEAHDGLANKTYASLSDRLNFMDSRRVDKTRMSKNVKDYGARGSWTSVPASTYYDTLESLQIDFPLAVSLNDEMDLLAIEKLVNTTNNSVYIPAGGYMLNRQINISKGVYIFGAGRTASILQYNGSEDSSTNMFRCTGDNITIKDLEFYHSFTIDKQGADTDTITAINGSGCTHCTYSDLYIVGFNVGLQFGENSWVEYINRVRIQSCNTGITGNSEFNNVIIHECNITFCATAILAGAGRNILINGSDIERNSVGIIKRNVGDIIIRDNYFEFNTNGNITIQWWDTCVDLAIIEGNSFFTSTTMNEVMIKYHTMADRPIIIRNNNFQGYQLNSTCNILIPTNGTLAKPVFADNRWQKASADYAGFAIGVTADKINPDDYYKNGNHMLYMTSSDLSSLVTESNISVRIPFTAGGLITLPDFSAMYDAKCMKMVALGSASSDEKMSFDTTNHSILGVTAIEPNQIYSIYFNRVADGLNEVIVFKG